MSGISEQNAQNRTPGGAEWLLSKLTTGSLFLLMAVASVTPVHAQESSAVLEEVTVTARKRAETLQDVPIAMTTLGSAQLERLSATSLKDLQHFVPSLHWQDRGSLQTEITIRGVGGDARSVGIESGIGLYVDGVYAGRTSSYNMDLADIEQIEVLRGPQGTLFGKNTTGGALNITTKKPTDEFNATAKIGIGNYNALRLKGSLNGALSDNITAKLTVATWDRDGYLNNLFDGGKLQSEERRAALAQIRIDASDKLEINLSADYTTDDQDSILNQLGSDAAFGAGFFNEDRFTVNTDQVNSIERDLYGASVRANYQMESGFEFVSITSYRDVEVTVHSDIDQTPNDVFRSGPFTDNGEQFTQEFQLTSPGGERIDYVLGLYYYDQDASATRNIYAGGNPLFFTDGPVDTTAWAGYANVNFNLTDEFTLTTGLRITDEEKKGNYIQTSPVPPFNKSFPNLHISSTEPSWTVSGNYKWNDLTSMYGSVSRGFKSGGFNVDPLATTAPLTEAELTFKPEFVTSYELGVKADVFEQRGRITGAVFFSEYEDRQVPQFETVGGTPTVITRNAGRSEVKGVELEFTILASDALLLFGGISVLDGEYTDYKDANSAGDDFSGNTTEKTPDLSLNFGLEYRGQFGSRNEFVISPQYSRVGKTYLQPDNGPFNVEDGYNIFNLRAGVELQDGKYGVYAWGKNLGDEEYKAFARQFAGSDQVLWGEPRTYGVEFVWFGE